MLITDRSQLNSIAVDNLPKVFIEASTLAQMNHIVQEIKTTEVAWFAFVKELESGDLLIFNDCFIPEQTVSGAVVVTTDLGECKMQDAVNDAAEDDESGETPNVSQLTVHCHSHVLMACTPSVADKALFDQQYKEYVSQDNPPDYAIKIIMNQKGEHFCQVIKINTVMHETYATKMQVYTPIEETTLSRINTELKNNISLITTSNKRDIVKTNNTKKFALPYTDVNSWVDVQKVVELWVESKPPEILGALDIKNKKLLSSIVKDLLFTKVVERTMYNRACTVINSVTSIKEDRCKMYSFNMEEDDCTLFINMITHAVCLQKNSTGRQLYHTNCFKNTVKVTQVGVIA